MPISSPQIETDLYGEQYTFWVDDVHIRFVTQWRTTPITAFEQPVADSPIDLTIDADGTLYITYLDAAGNRLVAYSQRDGDAGTWFSA